MDIKLKTIEFEMKEESFNGGRSAKIIFETTLQGGQPALFFKSCMFFGLSAVYTFDDWLFLNMVANEIIALHLRTWDRINWDQFRWLNE
jgi:hypothetical protein